MRTLILLAMLYPAITARAATPIDRAAITEVVNKVSILDPESRKARTARVADVLAAPDVLRTGADSRAELVAADQTVTRVGSNTLFSFERASRVIDLQQGSLLFHSPQGRGGGVIRTQAASAAVLGTTIIVAATREGGMKVLLIEGRGKVTIPGGPAQLLRAGQMVMLLPGRRLGDVMDFQLARQVSAARLVQGFHARLTSMPKIETAMRMQRREIESGRPPRHEQRPPPPKGGEPQPSAARPPQPQAANLPPPPPPTVRSHAIDTQREKSPPPPPPKSLPPKSLPPKSPPPRPQ